MSWPWLRPLWVGYVEFLRGTPLLLQLMVLYFVLPEAHIRMPPFWAGVLGLAINYSAYEAENYRAGLLAIPRGQMEAALALGMSRWVALRRVIIPQAVRIVIPPMGNEFITLLKLTSLATVIAVTELLTASQEFYSTNFSYLEAFTAAALYYLFIVSILMFFQSRLEKRFTFTSARRVRTAPAVPAPLSHDAR